MTQAASLPKTLLVDSGFWYALYTPRDQYHNSAREKEELLESFNLILPWPSLYETLNSRFCKQRAAFLSFEQILRRPHVVRLPDETYREAALEGTIVWAQSRGLALVDMIIRLILDDVNIRKHGLLTFNPGDFADICRKHQIEML